MDTEKMTTMEKMVATEVARAKVCDVGIGMGRAAAAAAAHPPAVAAPERNDGSKVQD